MIKKDHGGKLSRSCRFEKNRLHFERSTPPWKRIVLERIGSLLQTRKCYFTFDPSLLFFTDDISDFFPGCFPIAFDRTEDGRLIRGIFPGAFPDVDVLEYPDMGPFCIVCILHDQIRFGWMLRNTMLSFEAWVWNESQEGTGRKYVYTNSTFL